MNTERLVAVCGSRRDDSKTRVALEAVLDAARAAGADTEMVDLREYELPPLDPDDSKAGDAPELRRAVDRADAVVLGTPNYHGSYSGVLKNALDYVGRDEFEETTVGLVTVAGGGFATPPLEHLRSVCRNLNAWTLPLQVAIPDAYSNFEDGRLTAETYRDRLRELGTELVEYAGVEEYPEVAGASGEADEASEPTVCD